MSEEHIKVITDREELYDKCENMEQLFDKYYLPLLIKHYGKTYKLHKENQQLKDRINRTVNFIENGLQSYLYSIEYKTLLDLLKGDKE